MLPANLLINSDSVHTDSSVSEENESGIVLPTHLRCACHTLSLVATTDAKKAMEDNPSLSCLNNTTTGKRSAMWNTSGIPKSAETLSEVLKCRLITHHIQNDVTLSMTVSTS